MNHFTSRLFSSLAFITVFFFYCDGFSQNLVQNGNFEEYIECPYTAGQIHYAQGWFSPGEGPKAGQSDYYNACAEEEVSVPLNIVGNQQAHSGSAYAGFYNYTNGADIRGYIENQLSSPLVAEAAYHFEMYICSADSFQYTSPEVGVFFSTELIDGISTSQPLPYVANIVSDTTIVMDGDTWTLISGDYTAQGGEAYIIIGNFDADNLTTHTLVNSELSAESAYLLVDDVTLTTPEDVGNLTQSNVQIFPNPFSDRFDIVTNTNGISRLVIFDGQSRRVIDTNIPRRTSMSMQDYPDGIYFYEISNEKGVIQKGKIMKN